MPCRITSCLTAVYGSLMPLAAVCAVRQFVLFRQFPISFFSINGIQEIVNHSWLFHANPTRALSVRRKRSGCLFEHPLSPDGLPLIVLSQGQHIIAESLYTDRLVQGHLRQIQRPISNVPITAISMADASIRPEGFSLCPASVAGILPLNCPWTLSARSCTVCRSMAAPALYSS